MAHGPRSIATGLPMAYVWPTGLLAYWPTGLLAQGTLPLAYGL